MSRYVNGRSFEWRVRDYYQKGGFFVLRSAGSKTVCDLICLKKGSLPILVQCKANGRISDKEKRELRELAENVGGTPILAWRGNKSNNYELKLFNCELNVDLPHYRILK